MLNEHIERFTQAATSDEFAEEIILAKKEYFSKVGEVFEEDKSFENKMRAFTEWYCFDRIMNKYEKTPIQYFNLINTATLSSEEKDVYKDFLKNVHSIFYVAKLNKDSLVVQDMCGSEKSLISSENANLVFQKGDVFEGRIIPYKEKYYFSGVFCFHPGKLYRKIKKELKKKSGKQKEKMDFLFLLSSMSLKLERYRKIDIKDIYTF